MVLSPSQHRVSDNASVASALHIYVVQGLHETWFVGSSIGTEAHGDRDEIYEVARDHVIRARQVGQDVKVTHADRNDQWHDITDCFA